MGGGGREGKVFTARSTGGLHARIPTVTRQWKRTTTWPKLRNEEQSTIGAVEHTVIKSKDAIRTRPEKKFIF